VAKEAKATLEVEKLNAVADRGYFNSEEILACEEAGNRGHSTQANDLELKGRGDASASRTSAYVGRGRTFTSVQPVKTLAYPTTTAEEKRIGPAPLLDQRLPELRHQA